MLHNTLHCALFSIILVSYKSNSRLLLMFKPKKTVCLGCLSNATNFCPVQIKALNDSFICDSAMPLVIQCNVNGLLTLLKLPSVGLDGFLSTQIGVLTALTHLYCLVVSYDFIRLVLNVLFTAI